MESVENIVERLDKESKTKSGLAVAAFEQYKIELDESKSREEMLAELKEQLGKNVKLSEVQEPTAKPTLDEETFAGWTDMGSGIYGKKVGQNAVLIRDVVTMCTMALEGVTIIQNTFVTK